MALRGTDLAILSSRLGVARLGASRLGFCPDDVEGKPDEPGEYVWKEIFPPDTLWTLDTKVSFCAEKPVASFTDLPDPSFNGAEVQFTDTSSPAEVVSYWCWDFGDSSAYSYDQHPKHTYSAAGVYTITLWVSGPRGSDSVTGAHTVGEQVLAVTATATGEVKRPAVSMSATIAAAVADVPVPAVAAVVTVGKLVAIDDGDWASNIYNMYDVQQGAHDVLLGAIVHYLTGKTTGASVLICAQTTTSIWGSQFQAGLTRLGHTFSQTFTASTLAGYTMGDFDMVVMLNLSGSDYNLIDPYLASGGSILTALVNLNNLNWQRYGFKTSATTNQTWAGLPTYNRPMTCPPLGGGPYNKSVYTSPTYVTATKTISGGTTTLYANDLGEYMAAIWEA